MRVRSKANPELEGAVIDSDGDLYWVQWDDYEYPGQRWHIERDRVEEIPEDTTAQEPDIHLALLDAIDRLHASFHHALDHQRDAFNLAIDCLKGDIQREMKK